MSVFTRSFVLVLLPTALGSPLNAFRSLLNFENPTPIHERDNDFVWGSLGDSWAAGVSYSSTQHTDYDGNLYDCHRWKDSYGPIMERNTSWTTGIGKFKFAACKSTTLQWVLQRYIY
jgi:hypothetical protein